MNQIAVFGGSAHPQLAEEICTQLGVPLHPTMVNGMARSGLQIRMTATPSRTRMTLAKYAIERNSRWWQMGSTLC